MKTLLATLIILGILVGCTTVTTNDPEWEYPKENLR